MKRKDILTVVFKAKKKNKKNNPIVRLLHKLNKIKRHPVLLMLFHNHCKSKAEYSQA